MKILLVRLSSMGDLIHTLPAITDLARHRPDVQLDWLCEAGFADIARLHPFVKNVHPMRWRQWRKQLFQAATHDEMRLLNKTLKDARYEKVLDSQGLIKSAVFARLANAPIMGLDKNSAREPLAAWFYQQTFPVKKGEDAVWRNRQLFAQVFDYEVKGVPDFGVSIPVSGSLNDLPARYVVALHATSRDSKLWRNDYWRELFVLLNQKDGVQILLPWGNETEKSRAEVLAQDLDFVQVCPKLNLLQAAYLLQQAQAVVGVDTGLLHLANAVNRPLVGIYTDSDPIKTGVQVSAWASNVGEVGQMPSMQTVYNQLCQNIAAFQAA
ncbi:lipopolysaccharide heptosyltransferase I [Neisseriaceae bacterium B1]